MRASSLQKNRCFERAFLVAALACAMLMSACGQKGPLVLPDAQPEVIQAREAGPQSTPETPAQPTTQTPQVQ